MKKFRAVLLVPTVYDYFADDIQSAGLRAKLLASQYDGVVNETPAIVQSVKERRLSEEDVSEPTIADFSSWDPDPAAA